MDARRSLQMPIYGLDCPAAAAAIERTLASLDGVLRAYGYKSGPPIEP